MRAVLFLRAAEQESAEAAIFYGEQQEDLGRRFVASVEEGVSRIRLNPYMFPLVAGEVRRCLTRVFPFAILFRVRDESIEVLAVMHLRRHPGYWKERSK